MNQENHNTKEERINWHQYHHQSDTGIKWQTFHSHHKNASTASTTSLRTSEKIPNLSKGTEVTNKNQVEIIERKNLKENFIFF